LAQVWWEAWADLAALRNARQAELREETGDTDLHCVASPFHFRQIFRNLLDNALSAGGDPVRVVIRCSPTEIAGAPGVQIAVRDNGPGLSDEQRQKMFEPFFTTKLHGTGLGLAICRRLVEAHGGRIALGEGATSGAEVLVTLPRGRP
jgi:signal transduction histidine kinase